MKRAEFERLESKRQRWRTAFQIAALILCLFAVFCFCGPVMVIDGVSAYKAEARNECVNLVRAARAYYMEYSTLPIPQGMVGLDSCQTETDEAFMKMLLGPEDNFDGLSRRGTRFYNGKEAKDGRCGLLIVDESRGPRLVDPWGRPCVLVIDANYDGFVTGPDGDRIHSDVICYSLVEDGVFDAQDPKSW